MRNAGTKEESVYFGKSCPHSAVNRLVKGEI